MSFNKVMSFVDDDNGHKGAPSLTDYELVSASITSTTPTTPGASTSSMPPITSDNKVNDGNCVGCNSFLKIDEIPRLLTCLHALCPACVARNDINTNELQCPSCKKRTIVPRAGIAHVNVDCLSLIQNEFQMLRSGKLLCQLCDKSRTASCYCESCNTLCADCANNHKNTRAFRTHKVSPLNSTQMHSRPLSLDVSQCPLHDNEDYIKFCEECDLPICFKCEEDNLHDGHHFVSFSVGVNNGRESVLTQLGFIKNSIGRVRNTITLIEQTSQSITDKEAAIRQQLEDETNRIIEKAKERQRRLLNDLVSLASEKQTDLKLQRNQLEEKLQSLLFAANYANKTVEFSQTPNGDLQLLWVKRPVHDRLKNLRVDADIPPVHDNYIELEQANELAQIENTLDRFGKIIVAGVPVDMCHLSYTSREVKCGENVRVELLERDAQGGILTSGHVPPLSLDL